MQFAMPSTPTIKTLKHPQTTQTPIKPFAKAALKISPTPGELPIFARTFGCERPKIQLFRYRPKTIKRK
jgi:hypothetical protein